MYSCPKHASTRKLEFLGETKYDHFAHDNYKTKLVHSKQVQPQLNKTVERSRCTMS